MSSTEWIDDERQRGIVAAEREADLGTAQGGERRPGRAPVDVLIRDWRAVDDRTVAHFDCQFASVRDGDRSAPS
jgi:hypothetical protein